MKTKQSIVRDLTFGIAVSVFVFVCALSWGGPFIAAARASGAPAQAQSSQAQSTTFNGTIMRNGEQFVLRETSGQIYRLDDPQHAQPFEGKAVKVTGRLDMEAKLIHVQRIESATA
jgi:hypothetical protein